MTKEQIRDNANEFLREKLIAKGYTKTEAEILVDRFNYTRKHFGFARAYQMFIEGLID